MNEVKIEFEFGEDSDFTDEELNKISNITNEDMEALLRLYISLKGGLENARTK